MDYTLINLETVLRKMGRGTVWYHHDGVDDDNIGNPARWDTKTPLRLAQLGDTEGDISFNPNGTVANLTLPEISGDAVHESTYVGDNPTFEIPLFLADPDVLPVVSPTGLASAGHFRVRDVAERTIVIFPENLFRKSDETYADLSYSGGVWQLDGQALDEVHQTLLEMSIFLWRCHAERPTRRFLGGHGDDGKNIETVMFRGMMHLDIPDGERLFTIGDPFPKGIDLDGFS